MNDRIGGNYAQKNYLGSLKIHGMVGMLIKKKWPSGESQRSFICRRLCASHKLLSSNPGRLGFQFSV